MVKVEKLQETWAVVGLHVLVRRSGRREKQLARKQTTKKRNKPNKWGGAKEDDEFKMNRARFGCDTEERHLTSTLGVRGDG